MRRLAWVLVALTLLSACKVRFEIDTRIEEDGSGTVSIAVGFDDAFREAIEGLAEGFESEAPPGAEVEPPEDPIESLRQDAPPGWDVEEFRDDDIQGVRITRAFDDLSKIPELFAEGQSFTESDQQSLDSPTSGLGNVEVSRDGDIITFELEAGPDDTSGEIPDEIDPTGGQLELELIVRVTLPGKILEDNADDRDGSTLIWRFSSDDAEFDPQPIVARSDASQSPGGGSDFPWAAVLVAVLVVGGAAAALLLRSRGGGTDYPQVEESGNT